MNTPHWTDAHIDAAWDDTSGKMYYTGYDEAGAPIICNKNRAHVVAHLEAYARRLAEDIAHSVAFGVAPTSTPAPVNWDDAPPWANYAAIDANGSIFWYEDCPRWCSASTKWITSTGLACYARRVSPLGPEDAALAWYQRPHAPTPTIINAGDVLCSEYGDFLVVATNFTSPQQLGLVNLTDHQLIHQTVTGDEIVIDDFAPFIKEHDVYQVRRHNTSIPEPTTPTKRYNVGPSGPFRDCNITLKMLDAINRNEFSEALQAAVVANPEMSYDHVEDFVHYLMEDN